MNNGKGYAEMQERMGALAIHNGGAVKGQFNADVQVNGNMYFGAEAGEGSLEAQVRRNLSPQESLYVAAQNDNHNLISELVVRGVNVNAPNANGLTALHIAAQHGCVKAVQALLDLGAKIKFAKKPRVTPLVLARKNRHEDVVRLLEEPEAFQERQDALTKACEEGDIAQVKQLLGGGASPTEADGDDKQPLGAAVWGMNTEVVDTLLEEMKDESPMTWEECKAHNQQHYREVFMFSDFFPKTMKEWSALLHKMNRSPYLRALHLAEADKFIPYAKVTSSWEKLFSFVQESRNQDLEEWMAYQGFVRLRAETHGVCIGLYKGVEDCINRAVPAQRLAR